MSASAAAGPQMTMPGLAGAAAEGPEMALLFHSHVRAWAAGEVVSMRRIDRIAVNGAVTSMPWYVLRLS